VAKDVGQFVLGFFDGVGSKLGFGDCVQDINDTVKNIKTTVDYFERGFNKTSADSIAQAFKFVSVILKDFGTVITDCAKDAATLAEKMKSLATALSGNPEAIVKILVTDVIHVWHDRKEITDDCKNVVSDWRAQDYEGSGMAVGLITGELLNGLATVPELYADKLTQSTVVV